MKKLLLIAALSVVFLQSAASVWASPIRRQSDEIIVTTTFVPGP